MEEVVAKAKMKKVNIIMFSAFTLALTCWSSGVISYKYGSRFIPSFLITVVLKGGVLIIGLYEKQSFVGLMLEVSLNTPLYTSC